MLNYARTVADKVGENKRAMHQIRNNSAYQAFLGDFLQAVDDAALDSSYAHQNQMIQILSNPQVAQRYARVAFDMNANKTPLSFLWLHCIYNNPHHQKARREA